ncbi:MAG TPA: penicillin acylase family protein, partial [Paracoccaceae bacterium]|nr:penicillin acylase family protein [Paracoccaceae bacterium]
MLTAFRWLMTAFLGLAALAALALAVAYHVLSRSIPDYDARLTLRGISGPVEIVRSNANVPHIFAQNDEDAFFALGFAHAQDRLWQMTMLRRTAQGRLSEVFGERTLRIDELLRRYDIYTLALASVEVQDPAARAALEAYARGVNAWIGEVNARALGRGAPEFFLFSNEIAAWAPADSIAIIKLMALQLSSHLEAEVLRARVSMLLSPARLADILPDDPNAAVTALPRYGAVVPGVVPGPAPLRLAEDRLSPFPRLPFGGASNAFAAAPRRSAAGGTLLANDPHLGFTAPAIWYLARLDLSTGPVIGGTIPGMPAILTGRSESIGWGLTTAYVDDQDIVLERVNPDNPEEYATPEGWRPFETRRTIINVKNVDPVTITLRWTENGPVLPGTHYDLASVTPPGHVAALAWTALSPRDTSMTAALRMMRAQSVDEALEAGRLYVAPAQNLTVADRDGIAMQVIGAVPQRDPGHQTQGRMPAPGEGAANRWLGMFPYEENLRVQDPESGLIGNTNNRTVDAPFPRHQSHLWGDTHRIQRWLTLMATREVHTRDSFIEAQLDTVSPVARALL